MYHKGTGPACGGGCRRPRSCRGGAHFRILSWLLPGIKGRDSCREKIRKGWWYPMSLSHKRVIEVLEHREPDRVPTMDVMEEYSNIYDVLGKKPVPLGFLFANRYTAKLMDKLAPYINRSHLFDSE